LYIHVKILVAPPSSFCTPGMFTQPCKSRTKWTGRNSDTFTRRSEHCLLQQVLWL